MLGTQFLTIALHAPPPPQPPHTSSGKLKVRNRTNVVPHNAKAVLLTWFILLTWTPSLATHL